MPISYYMDVHVPRSITLGLRMRHIDVLLAQEDSAERLSDSDLLDRATQLGRAVLTFDSDFLVEGVRRQKANIPFAGIVFAHPLRNSIGACIDDLEAIAKAGQAEEIANQIIFLPL
jgi:hypothetical protein